MTEKEESSSFYDFEDATQVILNHISHHLKKKIKADQIELILKFKYEFLKMEGFIQDDIISTNLSSVNKEAVDNFVLLNALLRKIYLSNDELAEIWEAETIYLEVDSGFFEYDAEDAAIVIYNRISSNMQDKFSNDDLVKILDLKNEFLEKANMTTESEMLQFEHPVTAHLDEKALNNFVISKATQVGIFLTEEELEIIWRGELLYLEINDKIDEDIAPEMN